MNSEVLEPSIYEKIRKNWSLKFGRTGVDLSTAAAADDNDALAAAAGSFPYEAKLLCMGSSKTVILISSCGCS